MKKTSLLLVSAVLAVAVPSSFAAPAAEAWENSCAACHGAEGKGDTKQGKKLKVKDYTDKAALAGMTDAQLAAAIADGVKDEKGKERMQGFKDEYSAEEITALVQFIRAMAK
jgi:cytochrome c6